MRPMKAFAAFALVIALCFLVVCFDPSAPLKPHEVHKAPGERWTVAELQRIEEDLAETRITLVEAGRRAQSIFANDPQLAEGYLFWTPGETDEHRAIHAVTNWMVDRPERREDIFRQYEAATGCRYVNQRKYETLPP